MRLLIFCTDIEYIFYHSYLVVCRGQELVRVYGVPEVCLKLLSNQNAQSLKNVQMLILMLSLLTSYFIIMSRPNQVEIGLIF